MHGDQTTAGPTIWLRAGQALLSVGGIGSVKIRALQQEANLTTGSFYYHFNGMGEYLSALAAFYGVDTEHHLLHSTDPDPKVRLERLLSMAPGQKMYRLDMAMRDWAGSNAEAAAAVQRVDELLLEFIVTALSDLGFSTREARVRAHLLLAIGVSRVKPPWKVDYQSDIALLLTKVIGASRMEEIS